MNQLIKFLFPERKFYRPPRDLTAAYERGRITSTQALVMRAGLARDPSAASKVWDGLTREHGRVEAVRILKLELKRQRTQTFLERLEALALRILGEQKPRKTIYRKKQVARVHVQFRHKGV